MANAAKESNLLSGLTLEGANGEFCVCKVRAIADLSRYSAPCCLMRTDREISLVCRAEDAPHDTLAKEDGFSMLRIAGELDFSLVGILSRLCSILAKEQIPVFAISSFDTDYLLVRQSQFEKARAAFVLCGANFVSNAF